MTSLSLRSLLLGAVLCALPVTPVPAAAQAGDSGRGREVFQDKQCARCHRPRGQPSVGPALPELRRPQGAYELAGRLWNHAPAMFTVLVQERIEWPRITPAEMVPLMAYLQADPARDPEPDLRRGQVLLVYKGCLKCHTWRREGYRLGPDLAHRREVFAPPATWAATLWAHAPRMAAAAAQRGVLYPRFAAAEMTHLTGFLRRGGDAR